MSADVRFKIDENLPAEVTSLLQQAGHDAASVLDERLDGRPDAEIADVCKREQRTLMTLDADFASICAYPPEEFDGGIIVLRLDSQGKRSVLGIIPAVLEALEETRPGRSLWIVEPGRIRIRSAGGR